MKIIFKNIGRIIYFLISLPIIVMWRVLFYKLNWSTVINEKFSISGFYFLPRDIQFLIDNNVNIVINFADELFFLPHYKRLLKEHNIEILTYSVRDRTPVSKNQMKDALEKIEKYKKIHINCAMGQSRSFMFLIYCLYILDYGKTIDELIIFVKSKRSQVSLHHKQRKTLNEILITKD